MTYSYVFRHCLVRALRTPRVSDVLGQSHPHTLSVCVCLSVCVPVYPCAYVSPSETGCEVPRHRTTPGPPPLTRRRGAGSNPTRRHPGGPSTTWKEDPVTSRLDTRGRTDGVGVGVVTRPVSSSVHSTHDLSDEGLGGRGWGSAEVSSSRPVLGPGPSESLSTNPPPSVAVVR